MRVVASYYLTVALIFLACTGLFGFYVVNWANPVSLIMFSLLIFFTFSFALTFVKRLFSLFLRPNPPSSLPGLGTGPSVAVLYTTMNDVVPECLERIDQSHPVDVYVFG